jgi:DNA-binding CsgD family transcriptional regulator
MGTGGFVIFLSFLIYGLISKRKAERESYEKDQALLSAELREKEQAQKITQMQADHLKSELNESVRQVSQHLALNAEMQGILADLDQAASDPQARRLTKKMKGLVGTKATEAAIDEITSKIEELHPGLRSKLTTLLGDKKETEVITALLIIMEYNTEDIARLLQKSDKAVRNIRYRIRKKLELSEDIDFAEGLLRLASEPVNT